MTNLKNLIKHKNRKKIVFTAGPASLIEQNLSNISPGFGRGDKNYNKTFLNVISKIKKISGQKKVVTTQGSGSTALEIVALNFLKGKILIVSTGYYSERLFNITKFAKKTHKKIKSISKIDWKNLNKFTKEKFDWVWACPTETSLGLRIPIIELKKFAKKTNSKLALDATASIGLEKDHKLADVVSFSSCKGLFGLTGASFICYKKKPANKVNSFVLNIKNLEQKKMTGPIHTIQSLEQILKKYNHFKKSVINNKKRMLLKFKKYLVYSKKNQPLLCTFVNKKIVSKNKNVILYKPRLNINGSVVCHLGEVHLGKKAKGRILDLLKINE